MDDFVIYKCNSMWKCSYRDIPCKYFQWVFFFNKWYQWWKGSTCCKTDNHLLHLIPRLVDQLYMFNLEWPRFALCKMRRLLRLTELRATGRTQWKWAYVPSKSVIRVYMLCKKPCHVLFYMISLFYFNGIVLQNRITDWCQNHWNRRNTIGVMALDEPLEIWTASCDSLIPRCISHIPFCVIIVNLVVLYQQCEIEKEN